MPSSFTKSKSAEPQLCNMSLRPWSLFELCLKRFAANTFIEWSYGAPAVSFFSPKDLFLLSQFEQTSRERTWYLLPSRNFLWHYLYFVAEERIELQLILNSMWCHSVVCFCVWQVRCLLCPSITELCEEAADTSKASLSPSDQLREFNLEVFFVRRA